MPNLWSTLKGCSACLHTHTYMNHQAIGSSSYALHLQEAICFSSNAVNLALRPISWMDWTALASHHPMASLTRKLFGHTLYGWAPHNPTSVPADSERVWQGTYACVDPGQLIVRSWVLGNFLDLSHCWHNLVTAVLQWELCTEVCEPFLQRDDMIIMTIYHALSMSPF